MLGRRFALLRGNVFGGHNLLLEEYLLRF
jgi:hypothetical protein